MNFEIVSFIGQSIIAVTANLLYFLLYKNIYGCKYEKKRYYLIGYLITVLLMICVNQIGNPYVNMVYSFISANAVCIMFFESQIKKIWLHNLLIWFMFVFSDAITVLMWSVIEGNTLNEILSNNQLTFGSDILNIILMFAFYRIYITFIQKISFQGVQIKTAAFMIIMTFFEIWAVTAYAGEITDRGGGINLFIFMIGFLLINLFLAYVLSQVSEAYKYRYELSLSERLNEMHLSNYTEMSHKYEESRAIIHDIKKHLMVVNELNDNESHSQYLSDVYKRMDELFGGFKCSNKILSVVISQKMSYAKTKGINVIISAEDVPIDFIDNLDITAIFANLWDNAIEACDKIKGKKYIEMSITRVNDFILINIENSFNGVLKTENKNLLSTKPNHSGVGLKSVKFSVEKYEGVFMTNYNSKSFRAEITLPII